MARDRLSKLTLSRDTVLFTAGLLLTVNEAVFRTGHPRWELIVLFSGMMGLPQVLRRDEREQEQQEQRPDDREGV